MTDFTDLIARMCQTRADMLGTQDEQHYHDCHAAARALEAQAQRIAELERECGITSRYASKLEDVLRLINLASLKPNGSKEECGVIAREAINGHI
jgi:hypothetical protein